MSGSRTWLSTSAVGVTCALLLLGCASSLPSPVSPSNATTTAPVAPVPPAEAASSTLASLAIDDAFAIRGANWICTNAGCTPGTCCVFEVRFLLREVGGQSGATIKTVVVRNPANGTSGTGSQENGESCWRTPVRVPPGGTLDTFYTDEGSAWLGYCFDGIDGKLSDSDLEVEAQFVDDQGQYGWVHKDVTSIR
jgi:hypothetical protein